MELSSYLGNPVSAALSEEIDRITRERVYDRRVFLIRDIGFIEPTDARRITFEDSVEFERVHAETYQALGYELVDVPRAEVADRTNMIEAFVASWS
ncbi:MAG TPA: AAA family ATPase [Dermatophilaceae bacterium]